MKPPYRVPLVAEALDPGWPRNGLVAASLFAGCGGSSLGYRTAGYEVRYANEFVEHAADTYEANAPAGFKVDRRDVREVTGAEILEACGVTELDVLDGSPPCQPFSTAGSRSRGWGKERDYGDHRQRADDLVYEYARLVGEARPRAFVMENVKGLVMGVAKGYFKRLMGDLRSHGYRVGARVLDAQWLGVPQSRERVFVVGFRDDLDLEPVFPSPLPYRYSMADALPHLRRIRRGGHGYFNGDERDTTSGPSPTVCATGMGGSYGDDHDVEAETRYEFDTKGHNQAPHSRSDPELHPVHAIAVSNRAAPWHHTLVTQYGPGQAAREHDPDQPAPTVMARGIGGVREYQATVDAPEPREALVTGRTGSLDGVGYARKPFDLEAPSPTVQASGASTTRVEVTGGAPPPPDDPGESSPILPSEAAGAGRDADPEAPSPTVMRQHIGFSAILPTTERRKLTIPEVRALCGFPDDFTVEGDYADRWARFGNSVCPPVARAVGEAVAGALGTAV